MQKYWRVWKVAQALDCSRREVYQLIQQGKLPATRIGVRGIRVAEDSLLHYLEAQKVIPKG